MLFLVCGDHKAAVGEGKTLAASRRQKMTTNIGA
jgi:hypothetical protein